MDTFPQHGNGEAIKILHFPQRFGEKIRPAVALLGAAPQPWNHGVNALGSGTIASLFHIFKNARVCFVDYGHQPSAHRAKLGERSVPIETVLLRFSRKPWQPNHVLRLLAVAVLLRLSIFQPWRRKMISRNPTLHSLNQLQMFLSIAGGDSFSDIYGLSRLFYVTLPQILILMLGKPLVLLPQTYGPFKNRPARWAARFILKRASLIYSRDQEGLKVVRDLLGRHDPRTRFAFDMGFALEPLPPAKEVQGRLDALKEKGRLVGFNVSGLLHMGGYNRKNMFRLKGDYPSLVRAVLDYLIVKQGYEVLLIPHVFGDGEGYESDVPACGDSWLNWRRNIKAGFIIWKGILTSMKSSISSGSATFSWGRACMPASLRSRNACRRWGWPIAVNLPEFLSRWAAVRGWWICARLRRSASIGGNRAGASGQVPSSA